MRALQVTQVACTFRGALLATALGLASAADFQSRHRDSPPPIEPITGISEDDWHLKVRLPTETLAAEAVAKLTDSQVIVVYVERLRWGNRTSALAAAIDQDMIARPMSADFLIKYLQTHTWPGDRSALFYWLRDHPAYPARQRILKEALRLFYAEGEGKDWPYLTTKALANFIAAEGTPEQAKLLDELVKRDKGFQLEKDRYLLGVGRSKPVEGAASPSNLPPSGQLTAPPQANKAMPTQTPATEEPVSSTPWSIIVVLIVAAGSLLWLLLKRRS